MMDKDSVNELHNVNITAIRPLITPDELKQEFPISDAVQKSIVAHRRDIINILKGEDHRLFVVVGPCSIHDPIAAWEYAQKLNTLREKLNDKMIIVMRMYFEKPRTTVGWKGLINDPHLDDSCNMNAGLRVARKLLLEVAELGLPMATEVLDPITPQYIANLISWAAIGARTTESQTHREVSSGLSMPVGFKNATSGDIQVAIDAIKSARNPHSFIGINQEGKTSIVRTAGNQNCHIVLRGGSSKPNFDEASIADTMHKFDSAGMKASIMVDCSHANSGKDYKKQPDVLANIIEQRNKGNHAIVGLMIESNLKAGSQKIPTDLSELQYGVSITDACMDWESTEQMLLEAYKALK